mmetsp:Transcript_14418/g.22370  ORF Transcript_14418/g.22370 Transcript_14418/m.22370 type:complete len:88 (-) Transcript_14418:357-620(-)
MRQYQQGELEKESKNRKLMVRNRIEQIDTRISSTIKEAVAAFSKCKSKFKEIKRKEEEDHEDGIEKEYRSPRRGSKRISVSSKNNDS